MWQVVKCGCHGCVEWGHFDNVQKQYQKSVLMKHLEDAIFTCFVCDLISSFKVPFMSLILFQRSGYKEILKCLNDSSLSQSCSVAETELEPRLAGWPQSSFSVKSPGKRTTLCIVCYMWEWQGRMRTSFVSRPFLIPKKYLIFLMSIFIQLLLSF